MIGEALNSLINVASWRTLIARYCSKSTNHTINVPFEFAADCVASRQAILNQGKACLPVSCLDKVLQVIFRKLLDIGLQQARTSILHLNDDDRLEKLFHRIKVI